VGKDPSFEPVIRFCINASNAVTTVSQSLKNDTIKYFGIERQIHVIPNFIHIQENSTTFCHQELRKKYANTNEKIICHISNFRPVKRIEDVIKIFALIDKQIAAKLILVGDGPDRYMAEKLSRELGLIDRVVFFGKVRDTNHILPIADLFLLPSEYESFGLSALEAMASGVPVLSTNAGGLSEINRNGITGYLANVGDVHGMAKMGSTLLGNESLLLQMKTAAAKHALQFDIEKIVPQYEALYRQCVGE
jgi:N-acetyl-alpha-D-glucosaminyl L-malate synthase BshA